MIEPGDGQPNPSTPEAEHSPPMRQLVLVEPGAGTVGGHMLEKLLLWCRGVSQLGFHPTVVSWNAPRLSIPNAIPVVVIGAGPKALFTFVPKKQQPKFAEFWTYSRAFQVARKANCPVLGLTASSPIPIAMAASTAKPHGPWGQIVMYGGLVGTPNGVRMRPRARMAFEALLRRQCHLFCNAPLTVEMLARIAGDHRKYVHNLPDPIDVPSTLKRPNDYDNGVLRVLVPGQDDHRRTPLWHLSHLQGVKVDELVVHEPGKAAAQLRDGSAWSQPPTVGSLRVVSDYLAGDSLTSTFAGATITLLAYAEDFLQGSANLALSIVCGTPVVCTRFPYARDLQARYGCIGEFFAYGDVESFNRAFHALLHWNDANMAEFEAARQRLIAAVDHRAIVREALRSIGCSGVS